MNKQIQIGEQVIGLRRKNGRYGLRQVIGKLIEILPQPDDYGYRYIVETRVKGWLSGKDIIEKCKCFKIRRV